MDALEKMNELSDRICVVTGASRGAGRAIAHVLGEAKATVYVTGRSVGGERTTENLPGTIDETAEEVTRRGGTGIPVRVDHTFDRDVESLFKRIKSKHGRLDLLVNNVWGGYEQHSGEGFVAPFWEQPLPRHWDRMFRAGVRAHFMASWFAAPIMIERGSGLIIHTTAWAFGAYLGNAIYDTAKAAIARMAFAMGQELQPHGVSCVALAPGFMRTERVMAAHEDDPFDLSATESPEYIGRATVALASDPNVIAKTGNLLTAGELAREYGFTDVDGSQPEPFRLPEE